MKHDVFILGVVVEAHDACDALFVEDRALPFGSPKCIAIGIDQRAFEINSPAGCRREAMRKQLPEFFSLDPYRKVSSLLRRKFVTLLVECPLLDLVRLEEQ